MKNSQQILEDYQNKVFVKDIMLKYSLSHRKLKAFLEEKGVYQKHSALLMSKEKENFIVENYSKMSNLDIAKTLNISEDWLTQKAKKLGLMVKGSGWKYENNNYFNTIDTNSPEFHYFLGWVCSDGNVSKNLLQTNITTKDREIVELFQSIYPFGKIYDSKTQKGEPIFHFTILSKDFARNMENIGVTPNKSKTLDIDEKWLTSDFIRGYFEGDGCIRKNRFEISFVGASDAILLKIVKRLEQEKITVSMNSEGSYFRIHIYNRTNICKFYSFVYLDCKNLFLMRKREIFDRLLSNG